MRKQGVFFVFASVALMGFYSCEFTETTSVEQDTVQEASQVENNTETSSNSKTEADEKPQSTKISIPKGYSVFDSIKGDLNADGVNDIVYIVKGTDPKKWEMNQFDEKVDRNRRGILVYVSNGGSFRRVTENLDCFSSENEDGGVYFPPELGVEVKKGKLYINYGHGRYGYWSYTFRYQEEKMKLIGYDQVDLHGPITQFEYSFNFLTGKKLTKENTNREMDDPEADEVFKETWSTFPKKELRTLSSIDDFDGLSF